MPSEGLIGNIKEPVADLGDDGTGAGGQRALAQGGVVAQQQLVTGSGKSCLAQGFGTVQWA
jgi:hypothetical protein